MPKTLASQLGEIGVKPGDITRLALSHMHPDHTGNANLFTAATLYMQAAEYDAAFGRADGRDYLAEADVDVVVFQHLPLAIQSRILREGRALYVRDEDALYEVATRSVKAFELFRPIHQAYLNEVARG